MAELRHDAPDCGPAGGTSGSAIVEALPPVGLVGVRVDLSDSAVRVALEEESGLSLPGVRQAVLRDEERTGWYWMAPDELLLRIPPDHAASTLEALEAALSGMHCLVVDLSDSRAFFRIAGPFAREVLAKGAPVDLHPEAFPQGMFRRTHIAGVAVAFSLVAEGPDTFELFCARSHARYMRDWLGNAARPGTMTGVYTPPDRVEPGSGYPISKRINSKAM